MDIIVDKIEVITIHRKAIVYQTGEQLIQRRIDIFGHLSWNFFPYLVDVRAQLPPRDPGDPYYYQDGTIWNQSWTAPISASFVCYVDVTHGYGAWLSPVTKEGLYKITLQGSWVPFFVLPATEKLFIEVDTRGRNDREEYWDF